MTHNPVLSMILVLLISILPSSIIPSLSNVLSRAEVTAVPEAAAKVTSTGTADLSADLNAIVTAETVTETAQQKRAVLIACDRFVTCADTVPGARSSAEKVAAVLEQDALPYQSILTVTDTALSEASLALLLKEAFADAGENDLCILYIATHGLQDAENENDPFAFVFSDGDKEYIISAVTLRDILLSLPGKKVLIADCCYSGAMIGKGTLPGAVNLFAGTGIDVLCSAGGNEQSYYYRDAEGEYAAGFFSSLLAAGLDVGCSAAADRNGDQQITLKEVRDHLLKTYAVSTVCCYPENSSTPFYVLKDMTSSVLPVMDICFENDVLTTSDRTIRFSFTVTEACELYYQLVYYREGSWQFDTAEVMQDTADGSLLTPGIKSRSITLNAVNENDAGYAMLSLYLMKDGTPVILQQQLICVQPDSGPVTLSVQSSSSFCPAQGEELSLFVFHDKPCSLTVSVIDENGKTVCYLSSSLCSRPQDAFNRGTALTWDGRLKDGSLAPEGSYHMKVRTILGSETFVFEGADFMITSASMPK